MIGMLLLSWTGLSDLQHSHYMTGSCLDLSYRSFGK